MRYLRKRIMVRTLSIFFLIIFVQSLFPQQYLYALTSGPHQVEYTSYEGPGATDMVNLSTGDFSFSLPLLEVPGPEGNFSLPLTYNAGIGLDQEASWLGLGWNMNPGSITRNINGFPDDANGESQVVAVKDPGVHGWDMNVFGVGSFGWNNQNGHYGGLSFLGLINATWDEHSSSVGVIGINVSDDNVTVNGVQMAVGITTLISFGATAYAQGAMAGVKSLATGALMGYGMSVLSSIADGGSPAPTAGYWKYSKKESGRIYSPIGVYKEFKIWLDQTRVEDMYGTLYLGNAPTTPNISSNGGLADLYLRNGGVSETLYQFLKTTGTANQGAASDVTFETSETLAYPFFNTPITLANDNFSVKFTGISGSIVPYRLEVGSVSMPREMTANHIRLAPVPYLSNDPSYPSGAYKVPFVYEGASNAYFHHVGAAPPSTVTTPTPYFGITATATSSGNNKLTYDLNDVTLKLQRIESSITSTNKIPQHHYVEWLSNDEVKASKTYPCRYIDFLSGDIGAITCDPSGSTVSATSDRALFRTPGGKPACTGKTNSFSASAIPVTAEFMDYLTTHSSQVDIFLSIYATAADRDAGNASDYKEFEGLTIVSMVNNPSLGIYTIATNGTLLPNENGKIVDITVKLTGSQETAFGIGGPTGLGAFCITGADGMTYHFGLPLYEKDQYTFIRNVANTAKTSTIRKPDAFANTWLLTAITGSDFVDRNANGLADDCDWGHWVKLNYGVHTSQYMWHLPYGTGIYLRSPDNQTESITQGRKQLIYLNSIETRSHVALFKKSKRDDGKDWSSSQKAPLKLDEIVLLTKEHYKKLIAPAAQGGYEMSPLSNKIDVNLMSSDFTAGVQTFIEKNAIKRIQFNYTYDLCSGTLNSDAQGSGKLTLTSIATRGRNNAKPVPDYKFEYGYNPSYGQHNWDGFGMYRSGGTVSATDHDVVQTGADLYGSAWSLSKIITPIGSEIQVNYERDDYSSISGAPIYTSTQSPFDDATIGTLMSNTLNWVKVTSGASNFVVGDRVRVKGTAVYTCQGSSFQQMEDFDTEANISSIAGNTINFTTSPITLTKCGGATITMVRLQGIVRELEKGRKGDGIRVSSIVSKDEFGNQNKIRYLYKVPGDRSSGVLAKPADYTTSSAGLELPFVPPLGYPATPVIYGTVTVLTGKLSDDNDYHTKQVYEFVTPTLAQYSVTKDLINDHTGLGIGTGDYLTLVHWKIEDRTSQVGAIKSMALYNKTSSTPYSSSTLTYTDQTTNPILNNGTNNYQGVYSSSVLQADRVSEPLSAHHRATRTTVLKYPYELKKNVQYKDGFTTESTTLSWDFITGVPDQKLSKSNLGIYVKTVTKPAFRVVEYEEMGSKAENINYKNMLAPIAETYVYRSDANGSNLGLISASVQTWKKVWHNYRYYNGTTFADDPNSPVVPVWRKHASYVWKGNYGLLRQDGTQAFTTYDEYQFSPSASNANWQYTGETKRYDHFSTPLETKGQDSIYSSVKMSYDNRTMIAEASNARFTEIAFSSAEDVVAGIPFFGGEVALGSGTVLSKRKGEFTQTNTGDVNITAPHTGDAALVVNGTNAKGFIYKPTGLLPLRTYRASVWTNDTDGRIYYKLNGGSEQTSAAPTVTKKAGKWYRLDFEIAVATQFTSLEVGVKGLTGKVVFDDFRFQPIDSYMTCYVYNPLDFEYTSDFAERTYVLDNNNLFMLYEQSADGLLLKVYRESMAFGGTNGYQLISEKKTNFRRFYVNP